MKKKIIVRGPALSRSGYGEQTRFALRALRTGEDKYDIYLANTGWGKTGVLCEDTQEKRWMDLTILKTQTYVQKGGKFDVSLQNMVKSSGEFVEFPNILEMDITKAYYKMARNLDYISEEIYHICLKLPKHIRLRLIGSIATHKVVEKYENKELKDIQIIEDLELRDIWFHICYEVGKVMEECAEAIQDYFIFYWVDGIYFQMDKRFTTKNDPSQQIIKNIFQKNKLEFSINKLNKISLQNYKEHLTLKCYKNNEVKSHFSVPYKKVKLYIDDKILT